MIGAGPLDRPVRSVHVSDLADLSNLLQSGELVLTTDRPLSDDPISYLEGLAAAGAVGVVADLGSLTVPDVARTADQLAFPVIALHRQTRFVEVTEEVHRSIVAEQYDEVAFALHAHEVFTTSA